MCESFLLRDEGDKHDARSWRRSTADSPKHKGVSKMPPRPAAQVLSTGRERRVHGYLVLCNELGQGEFCSNTQPTVDQKEVGHQQEEAISTNIVRVP